MVEDAELWVLVVGLRTAWTMGIDDAFFNRNWAGACGGRWARPGLLAD